jgi:molecular chaperone DnaK
LHGLALQVATKCKPNRPQQIPTPHPTPITPPDPGGLSDDQINTMVKEAEAYAEGDRKRKEMIEARNEADSLAYSTEKSLQEHKAKLPQAVVDDITAALAAVREASAGEDLAALREKIGALSNASMKIGESLAQQSGGSSGGSSGGADGGSGGSGSGPTGGSA